MPYGPGTYGSKVGRPPKKKRQDGGLTLAQTGKAMNMQGGSAGKWYYGRAYGPIQKGLLRKASRRSY